MFWNDVELLHRSNKCLCTVDDVFVDGQSVHGKFISGVSILMDNFHLLDNGRLSTLAGACG